MPELRGVIFDLDGCLVDSEPLSLEAIATEMRALGIDDATPQELGDKFLGVAMPKIVDYVSTRLGAPVPNEFAEKVEARLLATYQNELTRIPGASELLTSIDNHGLAIALATGGSLRRMKATLEIAGLAPWFEGTAASAEEVAHGKPAPDLFNLALERMGLDASDCIVVEDSPHGIRGAGAAGVPAIGFIGGSHLDGQRDKHEAVLRDAGAIEVFDTLRQVERFVLPDAESAIR